MEIETSSVVLSIAFVTLLTCLWKIGNWVWLRPKHLERQLIKQGFKVNPYKFLYGDAKEYSLMVREALSKPLNPSSDEIIPRVVPYHDHCINHLGDNYCMWFGPTPRVNISDPRLIKEAFFNYEVFRKTTDRNPFIKLLAMGLVGYEGEKWEKHRALLNPAFNFGELKHMVSSMNLSCCELISKLDALVSPKGSCEIDVWPFLGNLSADVISRTAFGSSFEEGKRIFELLKEQFVLSVHLLQSYYIPGSRFLPTKANKRLKQIHNEIGAIVRHIIDKKMRKKKDGGLSNDLLGILLKTISGETQERGKKLNLKMTIDEVVEECKLFYAAGQETTSVLLVWTFVLLGKNQKWQALAREEAFAVFGNGEPHFDGLSQLKTINMILNEVMRLYPPAAMATRRVHQTVKLGDYVLPAGVEISVPIISIHRDHAIWGEDAKEFKPDRFSEGISKAAKVQGSFLPFSAGPRICIGQNFSKMEAKILFAMLLRHFTFELAPSYVHAPTFVITTQPQHGAHLILKKI